MSIAGVQLDPGEVGAVTLLLLLLMLMVTDTLVTGRRLRRAEARADRLEDKVWALMETVSVAVTAAEVSSEAISRLPDPTKADTP